MLHREAQRIGYQNLKYQVRDFRSEPFVVIRARNQKKLAINGTQCHPKTVTRYMN